MEEEPYGTVDGDGLVRKWLAQMDRNIERDDPASHRKRTRPSSLPPSPPQLVHQNATTTTRFEKRPRHRTREDRYDPHQRHAVNVEQHASGRTVDNLLLKRRRTEEHAKKRLATTRDVVDNFASNSILNDRLTVCTLGSGRTRLIRCSSNPSAPQASSTMARSLEKSRVSVHDHTRMRSLADLAVADLAFNSMNFLTRPRERKILQKSARDDGKKERELRELSAFFQSRDSQRRPGETHDSGSNRTRTHGPQRTSTMPAHSPVTSYLSWPRSVSRTPERGIGRPKNGNPTHQAGHARMVSLEVVVPKPRRESSRPSLSPQMTVRYQDKGIMTETNAGNHAARPTNPQDELASSEAGRESTLARDHIDQACQVDSMAFSVEDRTAPTSNSVGAGWAKPETTLQPDQVGLPLAQTKQLPHIRSSSPTYVTSLERVVSGLQGAAGSSSAQVVMSCAAIPAHSTGQRTIHPATDQHTEPPGGSEVARIPSQTHPVYDMQTGQDRSGPTDNLIARVDRELARDAAVSQLTRQMYREATCHQPCFDAEEEWDVGPWTQGFEGGFGEDDRWWHDYMQASHREAEDTGYIYSFWRPSMFM